MVQISCGILHCNIINVWQRLDFIRLGNILNEAEKLFGERNRNYTLLGVELIDRDYPQIWFPCNCGNIVIQITIDCLNNMDKAIFFQVAHECVHCLCPNIGKPATILEEGLATWFSVYYTRLNNINIHPQEQEYQNACYLTYQLLEYDFDIIKKARKYSPNISDITKELLMELCPNINLHLANELTKSFDYNR